MVALTLRVQVACIQARGKGKKYIVRKYLDSCVKSSNYCDRVWNLAYLLFLSGGKCTPVPTPPVLGTTDLRPSMGHIVQILHLQSIQPPSSYKPLTLPDKENSTRYYGQKLQGDEKAGLKATNQNHLRKPSLKEKHSQPTVDITNKGKQTHVTGAPYREVNSKVATAPNTQSRR